MPLPKNSPAPSPVMVKPNITLEDDIPVPVVFKNSIYPYADMKVGQSFSRPMDERRRIQSSAQHFAKRLGRKFITRPDPEDKERVRCWRAEDPKPKDGPKTDETKT